ncbi:MAG: hypothetical protein Faunusvirus10_20 [Faunusvirus sp.]|jgi:hypothetical protein|uniref:Uncharacterized protein n=1 Tax=Faunusvirus sp. TaxID=2487766 RepID=A0A3G4ZWS5_9VIRU|nr:MAG: hypothetical protein Faunusvirus10_20 [Faunusvirus sp.]
MSKSEPNISWRTDKPISTMQQYVKKQGKSDLVYSPVPKEYLNRILPVRKGDVVVLAYDDGKPFFTHPIRGKRVIDVFKAIEAGVKVVLKSDNFETRNKVYRTLARFMHARDRRRLADKFERGKLRLIDLMGGYVFYEGGLKRIAGGIWIYNLGS